MNVLDALERGRARAESLMLDTCRITRASGEEVTDPTTGEVTFPGATVYEGRCKVQTAQVQEATPDAAGRRFTIQASQLHLPITAGPVAVGDIVEMLTGSLDEQLATARYRITATHHKSLATAQRVEVEEVTA